MAEKLAPRYGLEWRSYQVSLQGHTVCAIQWGGVFHIFDPMVGKFFYALDNRRLAPLDEMQRHREITHRVDCISRAHGHEFYFGRRVQLREFHRSNDTLFRTGWDR
jgi:hypothetical protein